MTDYNLILESASLYGQNVSMEKDEFLEVWATCNYSMRHRGYEKMDVWIGEMFGIESRESRLSFVW
jgi:hypothetical protein